MASGYLQHDMPNLPTRNQNPGDLRDPSTGNFQKFSSPQEGHAALLNDLTAKMTGHSSTGLGPDSSLAEFAKTYAPPSENNSAQYAADLANKLGVSPDTPIGSLKDRIGDFADAVASNEGYTSSVSSNPETPPAPPVQQQMPAQGGELASPFPLENIAAGNNNANLQSAVGAGKGLLQGVRDVSPVDTPVGKMMAQSSPGFASALDAEKQAIQPSNPMQSEGATQSGLLMGLIGPGAAGSASREASRIAAVPEVAKQLAAPVSSAKNVAKGLMSFGEDPRLARDAKAIEPLVQSKVLKLGNAPKVVERNVANLKNEIVTTAQNLMSRVTDTGAEVKPIVSQDDLGGVFKNTLATIEKHPLIDKAAARQSATDVWKEFLNNLPEGKTEYYPEDILKARQKTDAWIESVRGDGVFDPSRENGFTAGVRAMRQGANDLVASKVPDAGVKEALSYQTSLYNVLENLSKKAAPAMSQAAKESDMIENLPFLQRVMAKHPLATKAAGLVAGSALVGSGLQGGVDLKDALFNR